MAIEIVLWHAMSGAFGIPDFFRGYFEDLVAQFNGAQSEYKITPVYKGHYAETVQAGLQAYRAGHAPHILQSWEVGAKTLLAAECTVNPDEVMQQAGEKWNPRAYLPAVFDFYADSDRMPCFPFNIS